MDLFDLSLATLILILVATVLSSVLHGATGMAGGIVLAGVLSHVFGVKATIPLMTCALIVSHSSRTWLYQSDIDWPTVRIVLLFSAPSIIFSAGLFVYLSPTVIAIIMVVFLTSSFPLKAYAKRQHLQTSNTVLAGASCAWGMLAGNVIGPGFVLAPFLLGRGINRLSFVGSLAIIVLFMNLLKMAVFGVSDLLDARLLLIGGLIGLLTIPGNWLGRRLLLVMHDVTHRRLINAMTVLLILNFVYLAIYSF